MRKVKREHGTRSEIKIYRSTRYAEEFGPPLFLKPLYTQEITSFSRALAKQFFTREVENRSIRYVALVMNLLFSE
jgi:hypothetical protein